MDVRGSGLLCVRAVPFCNAMNGTPFWDVAHHHEVCLCPGSEEKDVGGPGMLCAHWGPVGGGESGLGQEASDAFCWREDVGRWRSVRGVFALPLVPGQRRARVAREVAGPWLSICVSVFLRNGL